MAAPNQIANRLAPENQLIGVTLWPENNIRFAVPLRHARTYDDLTALIRQHCDKDVERYYLCLHVPTQDPVLCGLAPKVTVNSWKPELIAWLINTKLHILAHFFEQVPTTIVRPFARPLRSLVNAPTTTMPGTTVTTQTRGSHSDNAPSSQLEPSGDPNHRQRRNLAMLSPQATLAPAFGSAASAFSSMSGSRAPARTHTSSHSPNKVATSSVLGPRAPVGTYTAQRHSTTTAPKPNSIASASRPVDKTPTAASAAALSPGSSVPSNTQQQKVETIEITDDENNSDNNANDTDDNDDDDDDDDPPRRLIKRHNKTKRPAPSPVQKDVKLRIKIISDTTGFEPVENGWKDFNIQLPASASYGKIVDAITSRLERQLGDTPLDAKAKMEAVRLETWIQRRLLTDDGRSLEGYRRGEERLSSRTRAAERKRKRSTTASSEGGGDMSGRVHIWLQMGLAKYRTLDEYTGRTKLE